MVVTKKHIIEWLKDEIEQTEVALQFVLDTIAAKRNTQFNAAYQKKKNYYEGRLNGLYEALAFAEERVEEEEAPADAE